MNVRTATSTGTILDPCTYEEALREAELRELALTAQLRTGYGAA